MEAGGGIALVTMRAGRVWMAERGQEVEAARSGGGRQEFVGVTGSAEIGRAVEVEVVGKAGIEEFEDEGAEGHG